MGQGGLWEGVTGCWPGVVVQGVVEGVGEDMLKGGKLGRGILRERRARVSRRNVSGRQGGTHT